MRDSFNRKIDYMRISITDRCNLRCRYCAPEDFKCLPMSELLTFEEIQRIVKLAAGLGISKIKLTGGEPLVRRGVISLVEMITSVEGIESVTMTSNGVLLKDYAADLKLAGLDSINVSIDTLDAKEFEKITGFDELQQVIDGIKEAVKAGLNVKLNTVVREELKKETILNLVEFADDLGVSIRFIEMMPIGEGKVIFSKSNEFVIDVLEKKFGSYIADEKIRGNGPARYLNFEGLKNPVGFISAVHKKFCSSCNRIRMSSTGELKSCLCYDTSFDLRKALREENEEAVLKLLREAIINKPKEHCFENTGDITEKKKMVQIGG